MRSYITGYVISILLTLFAFGIVFVDSQSGRPNIPDLYIVISLVVLAIAQLIVQLLFFMHRGHESKPRLNLTSFLFMVLVVSLLVVGSLWIMANLDYNMMHDPSVEEYIIQDEGME